MNPISLIDARTIFLTHLPILILLSALFGATWRQDIGGRQAGRWALGYGLLACNLLLANLRDFLPPYISAFGGFACGQAGSAILVSGVFMEMGRKFPWRFMIPYLTAIQLGQLYFLYEDPDIRLRVMLGGLSFASNAFLGAFVLIMDRQPHRKLPVRFTIGWCTVLVIVHAMRFVGSIVSSSSDFTGPVNGASFSFGLQMAVSLLGSLGLGIGLMWIRMTEWHRTVAEEVAERRRSEAALAVARDTAEAAAQAKSRFLASVSHDIRTPMNAVIGLTRLLSRTRLDERQSTHVSRIGTAASTLLELIEGVLDAARIEAGTMNVEIRNFDLADVLARVDTIARVQAEAKDLTLTVVPSVDVPMALRGDPVRLGQVLLNIVGNAVKFTEAGEVTLSVTVASRERDTVGLVFTIHDTGPGIAAKDIPHIFEPFRQAEEAGKAKGGAGLGLAIASQLAQLMGGRIDVQSVHGLGTTFTVNIPFSLVSAAAQTPAASAPSAATISVRLEAARILVAEDDEINREVAGEILRDAGAIVEMVTTGKMAVERLLTDGRSYDAILMDVRMPEMDGITAAAKIRAVHGIDSLPIIAVTAHAFDDERDACLAAGMNDFVTKPIEPARLLTALARCIPSRATFASVAKKNTPLPPVIPGFDIAGTLGRFCGNESAVQRLLAVFSERCASVGATLEGALAEGRLEEARTVVHGFRGAAATLGATGLSTQAARLEKALKDANREVVPLEMAALTKEVEMAATALKTYGFR